MPKHHIIISGTGRAGTTFLVQLLTQLRLDTGFAHPYAKFSTHNQAGMEWDLRKHADNAPYIVKSPALCEHLESILDASHIVIDHAIIPIRDLYSAAESRREVARRGNFKFLTPLRRGFRRIRNPDEQENVLAQHFYKLLHTLAQHDVPTTMMFFPRLSTDPVYLYQKIRFLLGEIDYKEFADAFRVVSRPELIHKFEQPRRDAETGRKS
jgi:hypothetical protein